MTRADFRSWPKGWAKLTDRGKGTADGLAGFDPAEDAEPEYLAGYADGVEERQRKHRELGKVCAVWAGSARRHAPAVMGVQDVEGVDGFGGAPIRGKA